MAKEEVACPSPEGSSEMAESTILPWNGTAEEASSSVITVRQWRMMAHQPTGMLMWFDPSTETPLLRRRNPQQDAGVLAFTRGDAPAAPGEQIQLTLRPEGGPHGS